MLVYAIRIVHVIIIIKVFYGKIRYCYIVVRWGKFCVVTASQVCPCCRIYFRNFIQILLVRMDSSGWFSRSVFTISYIVSVGCFTFVLFCDLTDILKELIIYFLWHAATRSI